MHRQRVSYHCEQLAFNEKDDRRTIEAEWSHLRISCLSLRAQGNREVGKFQEVFSQSLLLNALRTFQIYCVGREYVD